MRSEVDGCIQMKSFLSGSPEVRVGLSEDLALVNTDTFAAPLPGLFILLFTFYL